MCRKEKRGLIVDIRIRTQQVKQAAGEDRMVSKEKKIGKSAARWGGLVS